MSLKPNSLIVLENKEEYIILNETMYNAKKYFLAMPLDSNRVVNNKKVLILEEYVSGFETYVTKVTDSKVSSALFTIFNAQLKIT